MIEPRLLAPASQVLVNGSFLTWWSWFVTAPFAITLLGGYDLATTPDQRAQGVAVATLVHAVVGGIGAAGALLERRAQIPAARVTVVLGTIVVLSVLRPVLAETITEFVGLPELSIPMLGRILTNFFAISISLTLIALAVSTLRRRKDVLASLSAVTWALEYERTTGARIREHAIAAVRQRRERLLTGVPQRLINLPAGERVTALREFSEKLVRPVSHELISLRETGESPGAQQLRLPVLALPRAPRSPHTWELSLPPVGLPTMFYVLIFLPFLLLRVGVGVTLLAVLIVAGCGLLAEYVLSRGIGRLSPPAGSRRSGAIVIGYALVGSLLSAAAWTVLPQSPVSVVPPLAYWGIALASALCVGHVVSLSAEEERLAAQLSRHGADEIAGRRGAEQVLADAAEWVHGEVQSACLSAVAVLAKDDSQHACVRELGKIQTAIERIDEPRSTVVFSQQAVCEIIAAWGRVIDFEVWCDDRVWPVLDAAPISGRVVVDALSEALTNILRHSDQLSAQVRLEFVAGEVKLRVSSPGTLGQPATGGSGVGELRRRADSVELSASRGLVQLTVGVRVREGVQS